MGEDLVEQSLTKDMWKATKSLILLDTGYSRTMVKHSLVLEERCLEGQAVAIQCAHGDVALYPLAEVELEVEGTRVQVQAAISDNLPVSELLGTDVLELGNC